MKETLKSKKGITLITLVITIIVLIILAGISIAVLTGEDGLITKAKQARTNMENATIEEQERLNTLYGEMNSQLTTGSTNNSATSVNQGETTPVAATGGGLTSEEHEWLNNINTYVSNTNRPYDINPNRVLDTKYSLYIFGEASGTNFHQYIPISGYSSGAIYNTLTSNQSYRYYQFVNTDGETFGKTNITASTWNEFDIPTTATLLEITLNGTPSGSNYCTRLYYSFTI